MYRSCKGGRRESEYTCTAAGVDPQILDHPSESSGTIARTLAFPPNPNDGLSITNRLIPEHQLISWILMKPDKLLL